MITFREGDQIFRVPDAVLSNLMTMLNKINPKEIMVSFIPKTNSLIRMFSELKKYAILIYEGELIFQNHDDTTSFAIPFGTIQNIYDKGYEWQIDTQDYIITVAE